MAKHPQSIQPIFIYTGYGCQDVILWTYDFLFENLCKTLSTNIFLNEDVSPANQSIRSAKMGDLQADRQRGLILCVSGTELVTRMKRTTTHFSHENVVSLGTAGGPAARDDVSGRGSWTYRSHVASIKLPDPTTCLTTVTCNSRKKGNNTLGSS